MCAQVDSQEVPGGQKLGLVSKCPAFLVKRRRLACTRISEKYVGWRMSKVRQGARFNSHFIFRSL